jgi:hypothetical protein
MKERRFSSAAITMKREDRPLQEGHGKGSRRLWLALLLLLSLTFGASLDTRADDQADYERALASIQEGHYYRICTEVDGQKYYVNEYGDLTSNIYTSCTFQLSKVEGQVYPYSFNIKRNDGYSVSGRFVDQWLENRRGLSIREFIDDAWSSQVLFLNEEGRYAVRSSNVAEENLGDFGGGRTYWNYSIINNNVYLGYSYDKNYVFQIEENVDKWFDVEYERARASIAFGNKYLVSTTYNGQKYYLTFDGSLTADVSKASRFETIGTPSYPKEGIAFHDFYYFTGPDAGADSPLTPGHLNTTTEWDNYISAQIIYLNEEGYYAVRSSPTIGSDNPYDNTYWTVYAGADGPLAGYSFDMQYIWQIEEPVPDDMVGYERALAAIKEGAYYHVFTEIDGQKYYLTDDGSLTTQADGVSSFHFMKTCYIGGEYSCCFSLLNCGQVFDGPKLGSENALTPGRLNRGGYFKNDVWCSQVFFLNDAGRFAIRSTDYVFRDTEQGQYGGTFWTVNTGDNGPIAEYSFEKNFLWQLEEYVPEELAEYERAINTIQDGQRYRVFTEVGGQRYYLTDSGHLSANVADAPPITFQKVAGEEYDEGYKLKYGSTYFTRPNGTTAAALSPGHVNTTTTSSNIWDAQVFFLNADGRYAIRSANANSGNSGELHYGNTFWTVSTGSGGPVAGYSFDRNYVWQLEEYVLADFAEYERALNTIQEDQYYHVFTEVGGQKYYLTFDGYLSPDKGDAPPLKFKKVAGEEYDYGYMLKYGSTYFTRPNGTTAAALSPGHVNTTAITSSNIWDAQVFFLNADGRYAIRSTNVRYGNSGDLLYGNTFWTVSTGNGGPVAGYSFDRNYVWQLEETSIVITEHPNDFTAGTVFPQFQFKLEGMTGWTPVDDNISVSYTHVMGTQWKETYKFSELTAHQGDDAGVVFYDLPFSFTENLPDVTAEQMGHDIVTAAVTMTMRNQTGQTQPVTCFATLVAQWKPIEFINFTEATQYNTDYHFVTVKAEVLNLPRNNFSITIDRRYLTRWSYSTADGETPDWLEVEDPGVGPYVNAIITLQPTRSFDGDDPFRISAYSNDEKWPQIANFEIPLVAHYAHEDYDMSLDYWQKNGYYDIQEYRNNDLSAISNKVLNGEGWYTTYSIEWYRKTGYLGPVNRLMNIYNIFEKRFGGAEVTLSCEGEEIQKLSKFNGTFAFLPPADGRLYTLNMDYPAFNKHYVHTYFNPPMDHIYKIRFKFEVEENDRASWNVSYMRDGKECILSVDPYYLRNNPYVDAYMYTEEPVDFYIYKENNPGLIGRISAPECFTKLMADIKPELKVFDTGDTDVYSEDNQAYLRTLYPSGEDWSNNIPLLTIDWKEIAKGSSIVSVVDTDGNPITNATLNFAHVDNTMTRQGNGGTSSQYVPSFDGYYIDTDPSQYAELIEVVAPGYQPKLATMYLWNYDYFSRENSKKTRRYTVVMSKTDAKVSTANLETLQRFGYARNERVTAKLASLNLLAHTNAETLDYTVNADYDKLTKYVDDEKFGEAGWSGKKYARIVGSLPYNDSFDPAQLYLLYGPTYTHQYRPVTTLITKENFPNFSSNHCLFEFDISTFGKGTPARPVIKLGNELIAELPGLRNTSIDLIALAKANRIDLSLATVTGADLDDQATDAGVDMKDTGKAFDKFNLSTPPFLPFTLNVQREGDHFLVRGICQYSFLPETEGMAMSENAENLDWFNETYNECMTAANKAKERDDFFETNRLRQSAFVGIQGYISAIGYIDPENDNKLLLNIYDAGLVYEVAGHVTYPLGFGLGSFGIALDGKLALLLGLQNRHAILGNVEEKPEIDIIVDAQIGVKVTVWAEGGLDFMIAKAVAGVAGAGSIDSDTRIILPTYESNAIMSSLAGTKTSLRMGFKAYAEARFLFWTWRKEKVLWDVQADYFSPHDTTNPFLNEAYSEPIFNSMRRNVTKSYKRLRRKAISDLGTPIINNISGLARPDYMLGGNSLLFNNLKTASDYNDDRLQVYSGDNKSDLVNTGINAPMFDFAEGHSDALELAAFEQAKAPIDKSALESMDEEAQTKSVSEMVNIYVAMRKNGGAWTTQKLSKPLPNMACVTPAVAVDGEKAAVIWQQGMARFNSDGLRYIDGSLMLSRYDGTTWSEPIEIKRVNNRYIPTDYQLTMKNDSVLVMLSQPKDADNSDSETMLVYVTVTPDNAVFERLTQVEGSKPQMVSVNGANLVAYLQKKEQGRDVVLRTVDMKGEPTGKLAGALGMENRMVNDYRLVVDDGAKDLDGVSLLWYQSDEERTDNADGTQTVQIKNHIYTSKLLSHNKLLYFSAPMEIATIPNDVILVSMDGYLDGLDMKVAYCVTNDADGGAIFETPVSFSNDFDYTTSYNPYEVTDERTVPINITVANNGFAPIGSVQVQLGDSIYTHGMLLLPQKTITFTDKYYVTDDFDGTVNYNVTAEFIQPNSNSLKMRRRAAARPHRIKRNGTEENIRQTDMAVKLLNKSVDANGKTTILAEVSNASLLPLSNDFTCKVGLYGTAITSRPAVGSTEATVTYSDLWDATTKENKPKLVTITVDKPVTSRTLFLRTIPMEGSETLVDVRLANNVVPVNVLGKFKRGDVNNDGRVDIADVTALVNIINAGGAKGVDYNMEVADMNEDNKIEQDDLQELVNLVLRTSVSPAPAVQEVELLTNGACDGTFNGWTIEQNGGNGWVVDPGTSGPSADGHPWWASSYALCTMSQTVTLADKGISAEKVDAGDMTCTASADILVYWDRNGVGSTVCEVTVQMLDANDTVLGTETVVNDTGIYKEWTPFSKSFQLASGTRKLKYVVKGQDVVYWSGQFGPCFRNLSMRVK